MENLTGQTIRGYELRRQIGTGGFGTVYRAYQQVVDREVAVFARCLHLAHVGTSGDGVLGGGGHRVRDAAGVDSCQAAAD